MRTSPVMLPSLQILFPDLYLRKQQVLVQVHGKLGPACFFYSISDRSPFSAWGGDQIMLQFGCNMEGIYMCACLCLYVSMFVRVCVSACMCTQYTAAHLLACVWAEMHKYVPASLFVCACTYDTCKCVHVCQCPHVCVSMPLQRKS